ncbi:MAG: hypothetical protein PHQ98_03055 [Candidatus ainarchaeum sp.]|nr:hypothetical protein [Candidatus ainarchaeum sp.]
MNFPVGKLIKSSTAPFDFQSIFTELLAKSFNGYLIISIYSNCLEESICFFKSGQIVGCLTEIMQLNKVIKGDESINYFFNQTRGQGSYQLVELTKSQIDLIIAFDEKLKVNLEKDFLKKIPNQFVLKFDLSNQKVDLFNKYGLSGIN